MIMKSLLTLLFVIPTILTATPANHPPLTPKAACEIDLGPDVSVCKNAQFTLNPQAISPGDYTWAGSPGLSCYDCPSPQFSSANAGIFIFIATLTTPDCTESDTIQITVINAEAPQYEIAQNRSICSGDSIDLGGPAVAGTFYNWFSVPSGFVSNLANPKVGPSNPITYFLSVSNLSCPFITLDSVRISPVSLTLTLTPTDTIRLCQGRSRTLQAAVSPPGQLVNWSPSAGLQVSPNSLTAIATPLESTTYTATVSLAGCTRTRSVYIRVDSLPDHLEIEPADTTICQGAQVVLRSAVYEPVEYPDIEFLWSPAAGALTPDSLYNLVVQPTQTTVYRRITRNGLCADTSLAVVKVIPPAEMIVTPADTTVCPGQSVKFNLTYTPGVTDIKWEPPTGLSCTNCDNPLATPVTSQNYSVSGEFQGCPVSAGARVSLFPLAPLRFPSDVQLCLGEPVTLNEIFDPMATYTWTSTHPGFGTKTEPAPTFVPNQTATYYVTADNGCIRRDSVRVFVLNAQLTVTGDTTICKNFTAPLRASATLPGSFVWINVNTGQVVANQPVVSAVKPNETTVYTVTYTYGDNCVLTGQVTITISGEAPSIEFPFDRQICPGDTVLLNSGPVLPGSVYTWTANPPDAGLQATNPQPLVAPKVNTTYSVNATLGNCSVAQQVNIIAPSATLTVTPDTTVCDSTLTTITASGSAPNGSYAWNTGSTNPSIVVMPAGNTTYSVVYTYGDGCTLTESVLVSVVPNFSLSINAVPNKDTVDVGQLITLTAVVNPPQNLSNFTFDWKEITNDVRDIPSMEESVDVIPSTNDTATREIRYQLIATSPNGCVQIVEKRFYLIFPLVRFPNAFTPNGDGDNDEFKMVVPKGLAYISQMTIFNRWGQKVFDSTEPNAAWDGTVDGKEAPSDVYVYFVWWRRGDTALQVQATGDVTLLR